MLEKINGVCYKSMIRYGVQNLDKHCDIVNNLNVFPVPDGDTGTNMVLTIKNGLFSIKDDSDDLSAVAGAFAKAVVFGARGNSGVIVSQFFKGVSDGFKGVEEADSALLIQAFESGLERAHKAVAHPVEGTILTVIKEATNAAKKCAHDGDSIDAVIDTFLNSAKIALENTPELLPVLKDAGVVDSGGAGLVYFFEGVKRYLDGEELEDFEETVSVSAPQVDYSAYNKDSRFRYGYCTELLIQLLEESEPFDEDAVKAALEELGDSLVMTCESDKVKVHVHTFHPENVLALCHRYGEFLAMKIENMSVQHTETTRNIVCSSVKNDGNYAIVAVASDKLVQNLFLEMGADVVISGAENPSAKEFLEAYDATDKDEILVFPNSSNSILSAMQAVSLYKKKRRVTVLNCRSAAECYASLAIIDFGDTDVGRIVDHINDTINHIYTVTVARSARTMNYGKVEILKDDYVAMCGNELLAVDKKLRDTAMTVVRRVMNENERNVLTVFYGANVSEARIERLVDLIGNEYMYLEIYTIPTEDPIHDLTISFE